MSPSRGKSEPRLHGWRLVGTTKWWPAMLGDPPPIPGMTWEAIYR